MSLIKSISGIRGTIGGLPGDGLSPVDIVNFVSAYAGFIKKQTGQEQGKIVLGRDARVSGEMVEKIVSGTLMAMGLDVVSLGYATTPTVEIAVPIEKALGGIILTASHNPANWNALKLLNEKGEFLSAAEGAEIIEMAEKGVFSYSEYQTLGVIKENNDYNDIHIKKILDLPLVNISKIREAGFRVVIDCVNSVGGIILPPLLKALGVKDVIELYTDVTGLFPHNPEPLPENLTDIAAKVVESGADLGFVVDPDVDRLAVVNEDGTMFGEEYTLVAVADYVLSKTPGNTASNLSSTRALSDVTVKYGQKYFASAVGEVNVVKTMKENQCVIGGEGNGGVIYPELHYGRDALVGIALFLSSLAEKKIRCSELRKEKKIRCSELRKKFPSYVISKNKISLSEGINIDHILSKLKTFYANQTLNDIDGLKIDFQEGWIHLRKSNTEPIIRLYAEHKNTVEASKLATEVMNKIEEFKKQE